MHKQCAHTHTHTHTHTRSACSILLATTFVCHSELVSRCWLSLDLAGVSVGLCGCYFPGAYYTLYCNTVRRMVSYHHHHELFFMYHSLDYVIFTSCNLRPLHRVMLYCNVGWCVKGSAEHHSCQQCFVAEWLGLSATVRVRVRSRTREWDFIPFHFYIYIYIFFFFFSVCVKSGKYLCLAH